MELKQQREVVRQLMRQYVEIAHSERNQRMRKRFRDTNDLKIVRPPLLIEEIPWHEMNRDHSLDLICTDPVLRDMEWTLRTRLYLHKHFCCDNYIEPVWKIPKSYQSTGIGFTVEDHCLKTDEKNNISSHSYTDVLEDEAVLEKYHDPVITAFPEEDARKLEFVQDMVGDLIPVQLCGHMVEYSPWDRLAELRGVEPILLDMYDRPEYLHQLMELFTRGMEREITQMQALGLYGPEQISIHCTPAEITYPPETEGKIPCWFRTMAQMFSTVSPKMHYELDMQYSIPLAEKFAYTYYGCCEPLDDRIDWLKKYPNLRKVGCSPWANVERTAEQLGGDYVLSRKPNPAQVAQPIDEEAVRKEITKTVEAAIRNQTPCEFILKDISTVGYQPERLMEWARIASQVLDAHYGNA